MDYALNGGMRRRLLLLAVGTLTVATPARAQRFGPASYPNVDKPFAVAQGDTVQLLSRLMHEAGPAMSRPGKRLDFVYSTVIPPTNRGGRAAQADKAAQVLGAQAVELGVARISIGICDTKECAQRKHPPADWFQYQRTSTGWTRVP